MLDEDEYLMDLPEAFYEDCPYANWKGHVFKNLGPPFDDTWVKMLCSRAWCLACEPHRVWRMQRKIKSYLSSEKNACRNYWLVTRSVKNEDRLIDAFRTLHLAAKTFLEQVSSPHPFHDLVKVWTGSYEITYDYMKGYNLHQHFIVGADVHHLDYENLHACWNLAAGYPAQWDAQKITGGRNGAITYLAKYISKGLWGGLTERRAFLCKETLFRRKRTMSKRGTVPSVETQGFCWCCQNDFSQCIKGLDYPAEEKA